MINFQKLVEEKRKEWLKKIQSRLKSQEKQKSEEILLTREEFESMAKERGKQLQEAMIKYPKLRGRDRYLHEALFEGK